MALDLKQLLDNAVAADGDKLFNDVRIAAITSYEHLLSVVPALAVFPAAVICMGPGEINAERSTRKLSPGIAVIDSFRREGDNRALSLWNVLEGTLDLFCDGEVRRPLVINGVAYLPESFRPLAVGGKCAAYMLEIKAISTNMKG